MRGFDHWDEGDSGPSDWLGSVARRNETFLKATRNGQRYCAGPSPNSNTS